MREQAVVFGADRSLVGIVTEAAESVDSGPLPAVIILNAGLLHRVGPNRLHVKLARVLAAAGFPVLRFDFSGVGDSPARTDRGRLDEATAGETREAMDFLEHAFGVSQVVLLGLCSGADTAFRTARQDRRVVGVVGINGSYLETGEKESVREHLSATIQRRYYRRHLLSPRKWWRCITGGSSLRQVIRFLRIQLQARARQARPCPTSTGFVQECRELTDRGVHLLLVYSEGSTSCDVLRLVQGQTPERLHRPPALHVHRFRDVDHVFTLLWAQQAIIDMVERWARAPDRCWMSKQATSTRAEVYLER